MSSYNENRAETQQHVTILTYLALLGFLPASMIPIFIDDWSKDRSIAPHLIDRTVPVPDLPSDDGPQNLDRWRSSLTKETYEDEASSTLLPVTVLRIRSSLCGHFNTFLDDFMLAFTSTRRVVPSKNGDILLS